MLKVHFPLFASLCVSRSSHAAACIRRNESKRSITEITVKQMTRDTREHYNSITLIDYLILLQQLSYWRRFIDFVRHRFRFKTFPIFMLIKSQILHRSFRHRLDAILTQNNISSSFVLLLLLSNRIAWWFQICRRIAIFAAVTNLMPNRASMRPIQRGDGNQINERIINSNYPIWRSPLH